METAEHREPYESRGSRTDLGAPGGESPLGDSTNPHVKSIAHKFGSGFLFPEQNAARRGRRWTRRLWTDPLRPIAKRSRLVFRRLPRRTGSVASRHNCLADRKLGS